MERRAFGRSGVELSALCFGTMRLLAPRFDLASATALVLDLHDRGVTSFHVSHEYESYPLACAALRALRRARPGAVLEIVSKIPVPHFSEDRFDPARAVALIEADRRALGVERIDVVQWMVRHTPNDDAPRLAILERDGGAAEDTWEQMKADGRIGALAVFPYSDALLRASLALPWVEGLVTYLNPLELDAAPYLDRLADEGRGFIAIRPLLAGKMTDDAPLWNALDIAPTERAAFAIAFSLRHPAAASTILTASGPAHLDQAIAAIQNARPDRDRFDALVRRLSA
jgi:aryl-alcohol dehydrogenase-like predicted oxidoreductase